MTAIVLDTSALFSVLLGEEDKQIIASCLVKSTQRYVSCATLFEAFCAVRRPELIVHRVSLQPLINHLDLTVVSLDMQHLELAKVAYEKFGRGSHHAASLNMGDCFSYALAKSRSLPLLFKGDDFIHTDIKSAI